MRKTCITSVMSFCIVSHWVCVIIAKCVPGDTFYCKFYHRSNFELSARCLYVLSEGSDAVTKLLRVCVAEIQMKATWPNTALTVTLKEINFSFLIINENFGLSKDTVLMLQASGTAYFLLIAAAFSPCPLYVRPITASLLGASLCENDLHCTDFSPQGFENKSNMRNIRKSGLPPVSSFLRLKCFYGELRILNALIHVISLSVLSSKSIKYRICEWAACT